MGVVEEVVSTVGDASDRVGMNFYDIETYRAFMLLSIVPIAANTVIFATVLDVHPDKVSSSVLFSTFFGLIYVPVIIVFLFK